jgi:hypothetical protein
MNHYDDLWIAKDADLQERRDTLLPAEMPHQPSALEMLHDWILRDPSFRVVDRMARLDGRCTVKLRGKLGTYESTEQLTFDSAVRTALMQASWEGDK